MTKGLILKCSNRSEADCYGLSVFGSDVLARDEVLMIEPGDRLFLLNVDSNTLTGTFTRGVVECGRHTDFEAHNPTSST